MNAVTNMVNAVKKTETYQRATSETPDYFKKTRNIGLITAGLGVVLKIALAIFPATAPVGIIALSGDLINIGLTVAGISVLPKKDK